MCKTTLSMRQTGAVLITSLIFLLVLTLVALVASQSSVMETRMSTNAVIKKRAFESSEALRTGTDDLLDAHLFNRGWPSAFGGGLPNGLFNIPDGISSLNTLNWGEGNGSSESLFNAGSWVTDMALRNDGNNDGDYDDDVDQKADLYVYKTVVVNATGSATAMVAGYEGLGKSSASGGARIYFDLRSVGRSAGNAAGTTSSNYRYVIRN